MSYYDQTFEPWEIVDGQCVVADELEWAKLIEWNAEAESHSQAWELHCALCKQSGIRDFESEWSKRSEGGEIPSRPVVKVPTDIFEEYKGGRDEDGAMYCNHTGEELSVNQNGHVWPAGWPSMSDGDDWGIRSYTIKDELARFLQTVDATPHVDYLIVTQRPELVRGKWQRLTTGSGHNPSPHEFHRANVTLAVPVETQADIERLVPELLKCHDLCKGLEVICNPKEKLDFREVNLGTSADNYFYVDSLSGDWVQEDVGDRENPRSTMCHDDGPSISRIVAEGNEHPIHPDHIRSLRDQCLDAEVPFNFAGWGEWLPWGQLHAQLHVGITPTPNSTDTYWFPDGKTIRKVGKEHAGRLLDGVEHNGRVSQ